MKVFYGDSVDGWCAGAVCSLRAVDGGLDRGDFVPVAVGAELGLADIMPAAEETVVLADAACSQSVIQALLQAGSEVLRVEAGCARLRRPRFGRPETRRCSLKSAGWTAWAFCFPDLPVPPVIRELNAAVWGDGRDADVRALEAAIGMEGMPPWDLRWEQLFQGDEAADALLDELRSIGRVRLGIERAVGLRLLRAMQMRVAWEGEAWQAANLAADPRDLFEGRLEEGDAGAVCYVRQRSGWLLRAWRRAAGRVEEMVVERLPWDAAA